MTSHIMLLVPSNRFTRQALCDPKTFQFQIWKCYVVLSPQFSRTGWLNTKGLSGKNVQTAPVCWESVPTGQKVSSAKRLGGQLGGQFLHIMGNTHQAPLRVHLVSPSQMESPEARVVFDVSKNRLDLGRPSRSQVLPLGTGQIVSSLSAIVQEAEANLDRAREKYSHTYGRNKQNWLPRNFTWAANCLEPRLIYISHSNCGCRSSVLVQGHSLDFILLNRRPQLGVHSI